MSQVFKPGAAIYLISPQAWDDIKLSKHHYAEELVRRGCRVFFIEPPVPGRGIRVTPTDIDGLRVVTYGTWFPYRLKFRFRALFNAAMRRQARMIRDVIGVAPDLVWDFDNAAQFNDLRAFGAKQSLLHLVDDASRSGHGSRHADHLIVLHPQYAQTLGCAGQGHQLGHAVAEVHAAQSRKRLERTAPAPPEQQEVAMIGNLGAAWMDWATLTTMVAQQPDVRFRFIGPVPPPEKRSPELLQLLDRPNCIFTGRLTPAEIAELAYGVTVWLFCFDGKIVQGGPIDSHKMLEYLSTGQHVLSSWLASWDGSDLVTLAPRDGNDKMPAMLADLLANPTTDAMRQKRLEKALASTYVARVDQIDKWLSEVDG